jgi:hypothetical protein
MIALVAMVEMVSPIIAPASQGGAGRRGPLVSLLLRIIVVRLLWQ